MNIHFDVKGADELQRNLDKAGHRAKPLLRRALKAIGRRGVTLLRNFAPHDTGKLARSIHYSVTGADNLRVHLFDRVPYGKFVISGTRPHLIEARNAKALRFTVGGRVVFAKSVQHPGTKPNPYPKRAARPFQRDARGIIATMSREIARIITRG